MRIGNARAEQFQLDVYGEVMDTLHLARAAGQVPTPHAWRHPECLAGLPRKHWQEPDEGIWEVRGPRRHFTHSKVMAWVAFDRGIKAVERYRPAKARSSAGVALRDQIHAQVCEAGLDVKRQRFVQYYGSKALDASLLLIPLVGFLPPDDPRVRGTITAIERELIVDGLVLRYPVETARRRRPAAGRRSLPALQLLAGRLPCREGRRAEAEALFERLLALRNDVGLLAEEFDPRSGHMQGNFPQALSHMALVNTVLTNAMWLRACGKFPSWRAPAGIVFLRQQADVVAQREQPLEQRLRLLARPCSDEAVGQPEAAGQERALARRQAVDAVRRSW